MPSGPNKSECWEVLGAFSQNLRNSQNSQHVEQDQFRPPLWPPVSQLQYVSLLLATHQIVINSHTFRNFPIYIWVLHTLEFRTEFHKFLSFIYSWVPYTLEQLLNAISEFYILLGFILSFTNSWVSHTPEFRILSNKYLTLGNWLDLADWLPRLYVPYMYCVGYDLYF